jgi:hypothetical protein
VSAEVLRSLFCSGGACTPTALAAASGAPANGP